MAAYTAASGVRATSRGFQLAGAGREYEVDYSRCNTPAAILGWVDHLSRKSWMTTEMLGDFVALASERLRLEIHPLP